MFITIICSECGHKFEVDKVDDKYTPEKCPVCGKTIISNSRSETGDADTAWVE